MVAIRRIYTLDIDKSEKLLLYVLNEMKDSEGFVKASYRDLALHTGLHRNHMKGRLEDLAERNLIEIKIGKGKAPSSYKVLEDFENKR